MASPSSAAQRLPFLHGVGLGAGIAALLSLLGLLGAFQLLDLRIYDWRYRLRGPIPASLRIALVEVDDPTLAAYRNWPLPRETYAMLIAALEESGVEALGFDLLFLGESADDPDGDALLARITEGQTNLIHAITFMPEDASYGGGAAAPSSSSEALVRHGRPVARQRIPSARRVSLPYDALLDAADAIGHTAVAVDRDGVVRRIPQFVRYGEWAYPSLATRLVESAARRDSTLPQFELARDGVLIHSRGRRLRVPADAEGATSVVFAGDRASFPQTYSLLRVLQWYRDRDTTSLARAFRGKLVLVGATAVGEVATDVGATPFVEAAPLLYIHANAVNAAIQGRFLARPSGWVLVPALLGLGALLGALFSVLPLARSAAVAVTAVAAMAGLAQGMFAWADVDLPATSGLLLPPLAWIAVEGVRRRDSERRVRARERELQVARTIQQRLLPTEPPRVPEVDIFGLNIPAEEVGGDYFDWVPIGEDQLAVAVGDVSGHGVPAALLMSHLRASFHAETRLDSTPESIVQAMHKSLARAIEPGRFATFFLALISRRENQLSFCNAGHNPPLLVRNGKFELLSATGLPLAMLEDTAYEGAAREFRPGDLLVLYSDGVTEAPCRNDLYGDERLRARVLELAAGDLGAAEIARGLLEDVRAFAGRELATDDVTILVIRRR